MKSPADSVSISPVLSNIEEKTGIEQPLSITERRHKRRLEMAVQKAKPKWMTRTIAEEFGREDILSTTFRETIVHIFFILVITIGILGRHKAGMFILTRSLQDQLTEREFKNENGREISFFEIKSANDFWDYLMQPLIQTLYWEFYYSEKWKIADIPENERKILYQTKLMGVPRIRQVKVRNDSCVVHEYFRRIFMPCYDIYSRYSLDTRPFRNASGSAWIHHDETKTGSVPYNGIVGYYDGGGFYMDLSETAANTLNAIRLLKNLTWIERATRAVFVDFLTYNANLNLFSQCKLIFEFPPTGGVIPSLQIVTFDLMGINSAWDYVVVACEMMSILMVVWCLVESVREFVYFKWRFLMQFWSYVNISIIVHGLCVVGVVIVQWPYVNEYLEKYPSMKSQYNNCEYLVKLWGLLVYFSAITVFFVYIKVFKYLNFNKTMGQLNSTLKRCFRDVLGFIIMFFIIFFAFAELGYLLFGSQVAAFSSFAAAMFTLLRTILGDFDYSAIEQANRSLAPIYFLSYIFFVFFVLLNMFLAIINDTYADVKTEIAIAPDEMQMTEYLKRGFYRCLKRWGCKKLRWGQPVNEFTTIINQISDALKKCGFSEKEIETFFSKYRIHLSRSDVEVAQLISELESHVAASAKESGEEDGGVVQLSDFITQKVRLDNIESTIKVMAGKVDTLVKKLEEMQIVEKLRRRR